MCGIAGLIHSKGIKLHEMNAMSKSIRHRGPDDEGYLLISEHGLKKYFKGPDTISDYHTLEDIRENNIAGNHTIGLIHRRLSILDLSGAGHQPMEALEGLIDIVFNGEIYNFKEIRHDLILSGYQFNSETDTEVILNAYIEWGVSCVDRFIGMWSFAILDRRSKELFLSRDRFGIKPLYFYADRSHFAFASEMKALLELDYIHSTANYKTAFEYISFGTTSDPNVNLFDQIITLPPGHNLHIKTDTLQYKVSEYYNLSEKVLNYSPVDLHCADKIYKELFIDSVRLHLRSDVTVGSALSGGLDSGTLVSFSAGEVAPGNFKTFTAAYNEKQIDESGYARLVTDPLKNTGHFFTYPDSSTYWKDLDKMIWHQDLPVNSTSMFAQWEVMKLAASENVKVLLDGQGADESLGGYYNFAGIYLLNLISGFQFSRFFSERKNLSMNLSVNIDSSVKRSLFYFLPEYVQKIARKKERLGMNFIHPSYHDILKGISVPARGGRTFQQQSLLSMKFGLQELLRYEDRNSMAFSIESRVPFLDHRLVEFSIALDNSWKIRNGWTKYILRKIAEPVMDKRVVWRKDKMGFLTPQLTWKKELRKEILEFLEMEEFPGFLDKDFFIRQARTENDNAAHLSEFWKMISFLKWIKIYKVKFK